MSIKKKQIYVNTIAPVHVAHGSQSANFTDFLVVLEVLFWIYYTSANCCCSSDHCDVTFTGNILVFYQHFNILNL